MYSSSSPDSSADEGSSITMRRPNTVGGRGPPQKRSELDMSAVLNVEQKSQLQQLVNIILDSMQRQVRDVFDNLGDGLNGSEQGITPPKPSWNLIPNPFSTKYAHLYGNKPLIPQQNAEGQKENEKPASEGPTLANSGPSPPASTPQMRLPRSAEEATAMSKKDENEIMTATLTELKRDALTYYGKWRGAVQRRIGDMSIKNGGNGGNVVSSQGPQQTPGNFRRPGSASRGRPSGPSGAPSAASVEESNAALVEQYPPSPTALSSLPKEKRAAILHSMLLILLGLENYSSYSRILLLHLASSMHVPMNVLSQDEVRVAHGLSQLVKNISAEEIAQKRAEESKTSRRWKVGLASAAGAVIIGITGGLAAPLVAAGIGTVFGGLGLGATAAAGLLGTMAESTVVVGTLFGLYGARATGKMADSYAKEIQDFAFLPLHGTLHQEMIDPKDIPAGDRRLRITVGISGWLTDINDVTNPWRALGQSEEVYALRWEVESLMKMGTALETIIKSAAWSYAKKEIISRTVFASLVDAFWPIGLLKISKIIDNPWSVGMVRAEKAGLVLADAIINKVQGERGITLVGYSLGARLIYSCLMHLAEKRAFGMVENVVLMGAPIPSEIRVWAAMKSVVAGRLVNVYSSNDYILGFLYRSSSWQYGVAGLGSIQGVQGVKNYDVSDIVSGHFRYQYLTGSILKKIGWADIDIDVVNKQKEQLDRLMEEEKKLDENRDEKLRAELEALDLNKEAKHTESEAEKKQETAKATRGRRKHGGGGTNPGK